VEEASHLPGVNPLLPIVLLTWSVADRGCNRNGGSIEDMADLGVMEFSLSTNAQLEAEFGVAHELGHVLSSNRHDHVDDVVNVMASFESGQSSFVDQRTCLEVRTQAAKFAERMWHVTIDPSAWTVTNPPPPPSP
jgi:hypothetical protein